SSRSRRTLESTSVTVLYTEGGRHASRRGVTPDNPGAARWYVPPPRVEDHAMRARRARGSDRSGGPRDRPSVTGGMALASVLLALLGPLSIGVLQPASAQGV